MASEAPSWADQWGAGGIGSMEDDGTSFQKDTRKIRKSGAKSVFFTKVRTAAMVGVQKIKNGTSNFVKWIKDKCKGKSTSK